MVEYWYEIKDYTDEDFPNKFHLRNRCNFDHESVAEEVAEEMWSSDPSDPSRFEAEVGVKNQDGVVKRFKVRAEACVNFYATEVK